MTYLVRGLYRPGADQERLKIRAAHIRYMLEWLPRTVFGAALFNDEAQRAAGMVVALDVATRAEADRFVAGEPYCSAGLFEVVEITALKQMTPPYGPEVLECELARELGSVETHEGKGA